MSRVTTLQTRVYDPVALAAACMRLNLPAPAAGRVQLVGGEDAGLIVRLPGWRSPVVIDPADGTARLDGAEGGRGDPQPLRRLLQLYAVEKTKLEVHNMGYAVTENVLEGGSIRWQLILGT